MPVRTQRPTLAPRLANPLPTQLTPHHGPPQLRRSSTARKRSSPSLMSVLQTSVLTIPTSTTRSWKLSVPRPLTTCHLACSPSSPHITVDSAGCTRAKLPSRGSLRRSPRQPSPLRSVPPHHRPANPPIPTHSYVTPSRRRAIHGRIELHRRDRRHTPARRRILTRHA